MKSSSRSGSLRARSLALESLEDRMLLSASTVWSGIDTISWNSSAVGLGDIDGNIPNAVKALNIDSDQDTDLIAVNYPSSSDGGSISVYRNDSGTFSLVKTSSIDALKVVANDFQDAVFFDADSDGVDDDLVVFAQGSNNWTISAKVYTRGSDNSYTLAKTSEIDFSSYYNTSNVTIYAMTKVKGAAAGSTVALNMQTFAVSSGTQISSSKIFSVSYSSSAGWTVNSTLADFGTDSNYDILNVVKIKNVNYVVCYPHATDKLKFINITNSNNVVDWNYANIFSSDSNTGREANWVAEDNGVLFFGSSVTANSVNYYASVEFSAFSNTEQTVSYSSFVESESFLQQRSYTNAVVGSFNTDNSGYGDLLVCAGSDLAIYSGTGTKGSTATFNPVSAISVTKPAWHSIYVSDVVTSSGTNELGTLGKDGVNDYILVGEKNIWVVDGALYNSNKSDPSKYLYEVSGIGGESLMTKAVFVENEGSLMIIAQSNSTYSFFVYNMAASQTEASQGKIWFSYSGKCIPKVNSTDTNYGNIINIATGNFLDSEKTDLVITSQNGSTLTIYSYSTDELRNPSSIIDNVMAKASYSISTSVANEGYLQDLGLGVWTGQSGELDQAVVAIMDSTQTNKVSLYSFKYNNTATLVNDKTFELLGSGASSSDNVYFSSTGNGSLACLYANSQGGLSSLWNISDSGKTNFKISASSNLTLTSSRTYHGLYFNYLNADANYDIAAISQDSSGNAIVETWYGKSDGYYEKQLDSASQTVSGYSNTGYIFASATADNTSIDLIIVGDQNAYLWKNISTASGKAGNITVLCQSYDQTAATDYTVASESARTWIDEWSNFYLEIWADSSAVKISAFTVELNYNVDYFKIGTQGVVFAEGYTAGTSSSANGKITLTVTDATVADKYGTTTSKVLLGKVYFTPVGTNVSGVNLPDSGKATWVDNEFVVNVNNTNFNGLGIKEVADIEIPLYPVIYDLNDDNAITGTDFDIFYRSYGKSTTSQSDYNILADFIPDGAVAGTDFDEFYALYGKGVSALSASAYEGLGNAFKKTGGRTTVAEELAWRFAKTSSSAAAEELSAIALESESILADLVPEEEEAIEFVAETTPVAKPQTDYSILLAANEADNHKLWSILGEETEN